MSSPEMFDRIGHEHAKLHAELERFSRRLFVADEIDAAIGELRELVIELSMHFGYEESLMEAGAYGAFEHHRRQHLGIMTELGLLLDRIEAGAEPAVLAREADLLAHWYREHVAHSDRDLLDWLASRR